MQEPDLLLIPGPVSVDDRVRAALQGPIRPHYGGDWTEMYRRLTSSMKQVFLTEGDVILLFGPGSAGVEAALASTLAPGDEVVICSNGVFGDRMAEIARSLRLTVHLLGSERHRPVDPGALDRTLTDHPAVRAVGMVHHETAIGLMNPIKDLCEVSRQHGALTVVDAVSSLGGAELRVDNWGIDICVAVGNKCLAGPVGIAPLTVGPRAWAAVDDGRTKAAAWYLNLSTWRHYTQAWADWHPHPTTMPTLAVEGLTAAVETVLERGLERHQERQARACARVRAGLREMGFEMLVEDHDASPVTTAVRALSGMDVAGYIDWLRQEHGLRIGGGLGELTGSIFRVGHMGAAAEAGVVDAYLRATADYTQKLRERSAPFILGGEP